MCSRRKIYNIPGSVCEYRVDYKRCAAWKVVNMRWRRVTARGGSRKRPSDSRKYDSHYGGRFVKAALIGAGVTSANMLKQASSQPAGAIPIFHPDLFPIGTRHRKHGHTWFTAAQKCNCEPRQIKSPRSFAPWAFHGLARGNLNFSFHFPPSSFFSSLWYVTLIVTSVISSLGSVINKDKHWCLAAEPSSSHPSRRRNKRRLSLDRMMKFNLPHCSPQWKMAGFKDGILYFSQSQQHKGSYGHFFCEENAYRLPHTVLWTD